jgi:hypothetical protein
MNFKTKTVLYNTYLVVILVFTFLTFLLTFFEKPRNLRLRQILEQPINSQLQLNNWLSHHNLTLIIII